MQGLGDGFRVVAKVGNQGSHKNSNSHIDASHSRQPLVKGERLVRYEVNAVMPMNGVALLDEGQKDASNLLAQDLLRCVGFRVKPETHTACW